MKRMYFTFALVFGLATVAGAEPVTLDRFDLTAISVGVHVANADNGLINWYEIIHPGGPLKVSTVDPLTTLPDTEVGLYDNSGVFLAASDGSVGSLSQLTMELVEGVYYAAAGGFDVTFREAFDVDSIDNELGNIHLMAAALPGAPGDFDGDGTVGEFDLDMVLDNWGVDSTDGIPDGWINDLPIGMISAGELHHVLSEWSTSTPRSTPEPSTWVLVLLGCAALVRRRR